MVNPVGIVQQLKVFKSASIGGVHTNYCDKQEEHAEAIRRILTALNDGLTGMLLQLVWSFDPGGGVMESLKEALPGNGVGFTVKGVFIFDPGDAISNKGTNVFCHELILLSRISERNVVLEVLLITLKHQNKALILVFYSYHLWCLNSSHVGSLNQSA